jgi:hypothetical protein
LAQRDDSVKNVEQAACAVKDTMNRLKEKTYNPVQMRDEFSEEVKRTVAQRVGYRCSNPNCRAETSGPQVDPAKALNVGVAAHITAASPGGARYNPLLSPEERSHPSNAIWLCQTCAKLIDNDAARFPAGLLVQWKADAESASLSNIGRTAPQVGALQSRARGIGRLQAGARIQIRPAIPRRFEQEIFTVQGVEADFVDVKRTNSHHQVRIPASAIAKVHVFGDEQPSLVLLDGRLQWVTLTQRWEFLPDAPRAGPAPEYGLSKPVDFRYPRLSGITDRFAVRWFREDAVPRFLGQGWNIFYDGDGRYLRSSGPDIDLILLSQQP